MSPEIHADRSVTFRLRAPDAREVKVGGEWKGEMPPMAKEESGVWSATTIPIALR